MIQVLDKTQIRDLKQTATAYGNDDVVKQKV